jgi:hypothetical protein
LDPQGNVDSDIMAMVAKMQESKAAAASREGRRSSFSKQSK